MILPQLFEDKMRGLLKENFIEYKESFEKEHFSGLRINTLKMNQEDVSTIIPIAVEKISYIPNGYYFNSMEQPARHPYYHAGLYYLQEPSAMTPASFLPITPGDKVLDICAAPGGKSTELAAKLQGKGLLVTNDISNSRAKALLKNIELFGVHNAIVMSESPDKMEGYFTEYFDKILVDAPCSGEGMFRKIPSMIKNWEEVGVDYYCKLQKDIIISAAKMLKKGGMLLFSTCTFSPEENEGTIHYLLEQFPEFKVVSPYNYISDENLDFVGFDNGHPDWIEGSPQIKNAVRLWPHKINGEGHFICLLQKGEVPSLRAELKAWGEEEVSILIEDTLLSEEKHKAHKNKKVKTDKHSGNLSKSVSRDGYSKHGKNERNSEKSSYASNVEEILELKEVKEFLSNLSLEFERSRLLYLDEKLYYLPEESPNLKGLRLLRNGLLIGEIKKNRFEASHCLALAIKADEYSKRIDYNLDSIDVIKYLKGETMEVSEELESGLYLICVEHYPLGWAKISGGILKNKYNPGWRWM